MVFEVENGKLTGVKGNPDHPMTRGGLCVKLKDYEKRHYHPDRLLYPMRRTGPKGSKKFERISWDEALDTIVTRWKAIIAEHGPQAIVPYSYLGNQGLVHGLNGGDAFFNRLGATVTERTFCGDNKEDIYADKTTPYPSWESVKATTDNTAIARNPSISGRYFGCVRFEFEIDIF